MEGGAGEGVEIRVSQGEVMPRRGEEGGGDQSQSGKEWISGP